MSSGASPGPELGLLSPKTAQVADGLGARITRTRIDDEVSEQSATQQQDDQTEVTTGRVSPLSTRRYSQEGDDADIAMQQMEERYDRSSPGPGVSPGFSPRYSPAEYKGGYGWGEDYNDNRSLLSTAKHYSHQESRKFLFKTGFARFAITFMFCFLIAFSLKTYEGWTKPRVISNAGNRVFNALMLGLSLGLGLNLASSLKRYAVILRWSILTKRYVSLEVFDLILGVETLTKVGKLMIISLPGIRKVKWLRKLPWFREARDDGTKKTWILCLLWILINIGAQILVAALSLFWPVDPSTSIPLLTYGTVRVSDLSKWAEPASGISSNASALFQANAFGQEATMYPMLNTSDTVPPDLTTLSRNPIYKGDGYYEYRFVNRNPEHMYTNLLVTKRTIQARASCIELMTKDKIVNPDDEAMFAWGSLNGGEEWGKYKIPSYLPGSISWIGSRPDFCGPRCTNFTVYQSPSHILPRPVLLTCNSTLSSVTKDPEAFTALTEKDNEPLYSTDDFARIATGSIAWTGYTEDDWDDRQTHLYLRGSKWSPEEMVTKEQVEDLLARFTIGAIAAFDDHGKWYDLPGQYTRPVQGQQLQVDWAWVLGLLGGICVIQLAALIALITFANKSIIRDESFFSLAMLLRPVVNKIGKEGMNLSGDEIKNHPKLMWKKIRYDYREGKEGEPNQVDIFFQGRDMAENRRSWVDGVYS